VSDGGDGDDRGPKIRVRGAVKRFGGAAGVAVLDRVDLDVRPSEFVALVGPSGCGKTTLLNAIAGFLTVDDGVVEIDGAPVEGTSSRRIYVAQEASTFPWLTVAENVAFGIASKPADERARIVREHVELVGLTGFEHAYPAQLSGGMRQRLEFARALAVDPDMLFLDEPFGALDAITRLEMRREIARIWLATRKTCLLVTHDVEEACALADRVVVMSARPARIVEIVDVGFGRPRDPDAEPFRRLKARIHEMLKVERKV
jgi:NitT/TauT family transport system ATP-binding protein